MPRPLASVIPSTFLFCSGSPFPQQLFYAHLPSHHLIPQPSTPNLKTSGYIVRGLPRQQRRSPRPGQTLAPFIFLHFVPYISSIPLSPAPILPFPGEQTGQEPFRARDHVFIPLCAVGKPQSTLQASPLVGLFVPPFLYLPKFTCPQTSLFSWYIFLFQRILYFYFVIFL